MEDPDGKLVKKFVKTYNNKSFLHATQRFLDLSPCTEYIARVNMFLGLDKNKEPIFVGRVTRFGYFIAKWLFLGCHVL